MDQGKAPLDIKQIIQFIFIAFWTFTLPGIGLTLVSWIYFLIPLLVFVYLQKFGLNTGNKLVTSAFLLSLLTSILIGSTYSQLFVLSLIPLGYLLSRSAKRNETPASAGFKGVLVQSFCWLAYGFIISAIHGKSIHTELISSFTTGINEAISHYRTSENIPAETMIALEQTFYQLKTTIPLIFPSFFVSSIVVLVIFSMVSGNTILHKYGEKSSWQPFRQWQLPDKTIWFVIIAAGITIADIPSRIAGINLLIIGAVIYCIQGLSIFSFFINKWQLPRFFKTVLYITVIFQSFGTALLLTLGLSSVWIDYRNFGKKAEKQ